MKFLIILLLCVTITWAQSDFAEWKKKYGKEYKDSDEEEKSKKIWQERDLRIKKHNAAFERGEVTWTKAHNHMSDWSEEKFKSLFNDRSKFKTNPEKRATLLVSPLKPPVGWQPTYVDFSNVSIPVKNQGSCGSCWVFGGIGFLEYYFYIKYGGYWKLSEQNHVDCNTKGGGCDGGLAEFVFDYFMQKGTNFDSVYPYVSGSTRTSGSCKYVPDFDKGFQASEGPKKVYQVPANETILAYALEKVGWITVAVCADPGWSPTYAGGILLAKDCCSSTNHETVLVGYGTIYGTPVWKIRNSWGSGWGMNGHIFIERGKNACNILDPFSSRLYGADV